MMADDEFDPGTCANCDEHKSTCTCDGGPVVHPWAADGERVTALTEVAAAVIGRRLDACFALAAAGAWTDEMRKGVEEARQHAIASYGQDYAHAREVVRALLDAGMLPGLETP